MDKISRSIYVAFSDCQGQKASPTAPIGSTQNVGSSVKGGRLPAEYDSSPMLFGKTRPSKKKLSEKWCSVKKLTIERSGIGSSIRS